MTRPPSSVPGIFTFQQTELNFYGESFKFIVMSEVKSVHNENEVSNTMKEVFALESRHLIDTFMAESFLHLIKFRETGAMTFLLCQNIGMSVRGDIKIWHGFAFRLTWTGVNTFYVCLNVSLSALYQPTERELLR